MTFAENYQTVRGKKVLFLFDVDGTLTLPRKSIDQSMLQTLKNLKKFGSVGFVGGSDMEKQQEQLGGQGAYCWNNKIALTLFDYSFSENGLQAYKAGKLIFEGSFIKHIGEEKYKKLVNFILKALADIEIPKKRNGLAVTAGGLMRLLMHSYDERLEFEAFDKKNDIRKKLIEKLEKEFPDYGLKYSIGGQISIDIFPQGWDKTFCLRHIEKEHFDEIHFFGDKTAPGGNDYEIFRHTAVIGHTVTSPQNTMEILRELTGDGI